MVTQIAATPTPQFAGPAANPPPPPPPPNSIHQLSVEDRADNARLVSLRPIVCSVIHCRWEINKPSSSHFSDPQLFSLLLLLFTQHTLSFVSSSHNHI